MARTTIERIDSVRSRIKQLENEEKRLMQQQKEADRKARTRRLIERGAILESFIPDAEQLTNDQLKEAVLKLMHTKPTPEESMVSAKPVVQPVTAKPQWPDNRTNSYWDYSPDEEKEGEG